MESRKYLKISHDGKVKRATLFCDFENFKAEACSLFSKDFDDEDFEYLYLDDDNDIIQLESQADYDQALLYLFNSSQKTLKVRIVPKYSSDEYSNDYPQLLIDSLYTKRINDLNEELEKFERGEDSYNFLMCSRCNRSFNSDSYYKHIKVCWKVFQTKRIPFNSRRKRLTREQLLFSIIHKDDKKEFQNKESKWKKQSQEFRHYVKELRNRKFEKAQPSVQLKKNQRKRNPFDSKTQRLKHLGEVRLSEHEKKEKRWKQLSQKFRAIVKLSKMLRA